MSDPPPDPLALLGERIELLATDPGEVRLRWTKLVSPLLRLVRWQPAFKVKAINDLIEALKKLRPISPRKRAASPAPLPLSSADAKHMAELLDAAIDELDANVTAAERACVVSGRVPLSRAAWLRRLYEVAARAARAARDLADDDKRRIAAAVDPVMLLPPLARVSSAPSPSPAPGVATNGSVGGLGPPALPPAGAAKPSPEMDEGDERLIELHLSAIDHLLDASRAETEFLGRRRRLLEAARKLLLDSAAALPLDPAGVAARRQHIAEQIVRINRLEAAGISPEIGLLHQAKAALSRGDRQKLGAALGALDMAAIARGDGAMASRTSPALRKLWGGRPPGGRTSRAASLERSTAELFGDALVSSVRRAYEEAREAQQEEARTMTAEQRKDAKAIEAYFKPGNEIATLSAAVAVDGCFDVGGVLSPVRVEEHETRVRAVSYPTQDLMLVPARDVGDIPGAVLDDPRRVLLSLAEGRLLTRKFIETETVVRRRTKLVGEARIYLLDGSDSMLTDGEGKQMGARARMRDAILLAELATVRSRYLQHGRRVRVVLHFRYFTKVLWPISRVDSAESAEKAMAEVIRTPRRGGTDIEGALLASFELVREARRDDPDLARAQIVLITDGEAPVREEVIQKEREAAGDVPVGVSVIALGEENPSLRAMVAHQRARGERAFYHFIPDAELRAIASGEVDRGPAIHLDAVSSMDEGRDPSEVAAELSREVGGLLDELDALSRERHVHAMESARDAAQAEAQALAEMGLSGATLVSEGERARREVLDRDRSALEARFARWFPAPPDANSNSARVAGKKAPVSAPVSEPAPQEDAPPPGSPARDDFDAVMIALATVAEVVSEVGGTRLARLADAIEVLERLLPDARLSPARYLGVLRAYPINTSRALRAVHAAARASAS
jgi:Mg-chelatase subunit ChlD